MLRVALDKPLPPSQKPASLAFIILQLRSRPRSRSFHQRLSGAITPPNSYPQMIVEPKAREDDDCVANYYFGTSKQILTACEPLARPFMRTCGGGSAVPAAENPQVQQSKTPALPAKSLRYLPTLKQQSQVIRVHCVQHERSL